MVKKVSKKSNKVVIKQEEEDDFEIESEVEQK